jgi:hypothetical protein
MLNFIPLRLCEIRNIKGPGNVACVVSPGLRTLSQKEDLCYTVFEFQRILALAAFHKESYS